MKHTLLSSLYCLTLVFSQCQQLPGQKPKDDTSTLAIGLGLVTASTNNQPTGSTNNTSSTSRTRQQVLDDYNTYYLGSAVTTLGWTGSTSGCSAGTVSSDSDSKVATRINYYRRQVGLPDLITIDSSVRSKVQEAALIMHANSTLTHTPSSTMTCYTSGGAEAAGKSNIALGTHSAGAITAYIQDSGSGNYAVGHRRWILYSKLDKVGHGSTSNANSLWVIGYNTGSTSTLPEFVSWPPKGYVANTLSFARWSFSIPNQSATFTNATITMTDSSGNNVSLTRETVENGYGDNTVVWVPSGISTSSTTDVTYKVNISGVTISGSSKSYSYDVTLFKP
jgi:Cysteine-rich secretory protein family